MAKKTGHYKATPEVIADARAASGRRLQFFQSDGEGVFTSGETTTMLANFKVRHLWGAPYDSNTNPFVERARRTVFEGTCTSLLRSGAPSNFWGEAENHKIFTINVLPSFKDPDNPSKYLSRKNLLENDKRPFNLDHLMAFGTAATCYIPKDERAGGKTPAQRRCFRGAIVGYADHTPAYRVWDLADRKIRIVSYNFTIAHEGYYPFKDKANWPPEWVDLPISFSPNEDTVLDPVQWQAYEFDEDDASEVISHASTHSSISMVLPDPAGHVVSEAVPEPTEDKHASVDPVVEEHKPVEPAIEPLRMSSRHSAPPEKLTYGRGYVQTALAAAEDNANLLQVSAHAQITSKPEDKPASIPPPKTMREAMLSPWWPYYKKAAEEEIAGHEKNGTWELVPIAHVPKGKNILRGKMVFDDKRGEDGKVIRFKGRFVAMGFTQQHGVDYGETFAGVVISKSFRILLSLLNEDSTFDMQHWDVKMAFTKAPVEEDLFMYQPESFEQKKDGPMLVCHLKKALYGLKQSAHNWQTFLCSRMVEVGFKPLRTDPCLYFLKRGDAWCLVATHVDDIFPLFNQPGCKLRDELFANFQKYVEIDNLGPIAWALKTLIQRDREKGIIKISQEQFTRDFLESRGIKCGDTVTIPAVTAGGDLSMEDNDKLDDELKNYAFQSDIGSLWWLANISRPDIFFAVHRCSKWQNRPSRKLWRWLQQIKKYLAGTTSLGITYQRNNNNTPLLSAFVDGAFACEENFKSRIGWFFMFQGNLVSWASENPKRVLSSSTEVECRGLSQLVKENLWQRQLQLELGIFEVQQPTTVYEDNTASITMSTNPGIPHKRSKHYGIEWTMCKEAVADGEILLVHVSTDEQPADMLTKPLPATKFQYFRDRVMGGAQLQDHFGAPLQPASSPGNLK
jgi:hypothetical protein